MIIKRNTQKLLSVHRTFAFLPKTIIENGEVKTVWLRFVKRKLVSNMMGTHFVYTR